MLGLNLVVDLALAVCMVFSRETEKAETEQVKQEQNTQRTSRRGRINISICTFFLHHAIHAGTKKNCWGHVI